MIEIEIQVSKIEADKFGLLAQFTRNTVEPAPPGHWCCPLQGGKRPHAVGKPGGVHSIGWCTVTSLVPSGKVAST